MPCHLGTERSAGPDRPNGCLPLQARPAVLVDAIIAKKNLGTTREMAPLTIALGPGFAAGQDVDVVVETKRGHKLGRIIREGLQHPTPACRASSAAMVPSVCSMHRPRVSSATCILSLILWRRARLWPRSKRQTASVCRWPHRSPASVRGCCGMLPVTKGFKVADVDPRRAELENCFLISDKARCIAGSVLELIAAECWN